MVEEKFLIDSNSFMAPYRQYYAFDLIPTYWDELSKRTESGRLVLLDMVKAEIDKGEDDLADWVGKQTGFEICNHVTPEIISKYQDVLQYVQSCGLYKEQALQAWAPGHIADPVPKQTTHCCPIGHSPTYWRSQATCLPGSC